MKYSVRIGKNFSYVIFPEETKLIEAGIMTDINANETIEKIIIPEIPDIFHLIFIFFMNNQRNNQKISIFILVEDSIGNTVPSQFFVAMKKRL